MRDAGFARLSFLMKDSRLALAFRERRINETRSRGKFLGGLLIDAVYGGRDLARLKKWNKARREIDGHSLESLTNVS